ncbi:protein kinase domain-containing protein [Haliangium sp.]|uniref:serine/threonine-protein kinase n=1 Tax=Haliangium sp. TaxID=2663208 RepID=UPI003D0AE521
MIGRTLGSYQITGELSAGGMGAVYKGVHTLIGRSAAIKVLLPELSEDPEFVQRFFNEAKATAAIGHPGIVEILDFGFDDQDGGAYLVMELLDGLPMTRLLGAPMDPERALALCSHVLSALGAAHAKGIVHRDLKPGNIMVVPDPGVAFGERTKLLDFGIAKLIHNQDESFKTRTGLVMGTPTYMAPEQCRGAGRVDHRADLYAMGCILFHMLCGQPPFMSDGAGEVLGMHQFLPAPSPRSLCDQIDPELDALVLRLLAKSPDDRPATAEDVRAALAPMLGLPTPSRRAPSITPLPSASAVTSSPVAVAPTHALPPVTLAVSAAPVAASPHTPANLASEIPPQTPIGAAAAAAAPTPSARSASTSAPTTLNSSVTSRPATAPTPRARRLPLVAGAIAVAALAAIGSWMALRTPAVTPAADSAATLTTPAAEVATTPPAGSISPVEAAPAAKTEPAKTEPPEATAKATPTQAAAPVSPVSPVSTVDLRVSSRPRGAEVYRGHERVGETPLVLTVDKGSAPVALVLKKAGYRDEQVELVPNRDRASNTSLRRRRSQRPKRGETTEGKTQSTTTTTDDSRPDRDTLNPF